MRKKGRQGAEQMKLIGACCSSLPNSPFPRYMCLSQSALSISPVVTIASYQVVCCEWDQRNESSPCPVKRTLLQTPNPGTLQRIMLLNDHFWLHFCDLNSNDADLWGHFTSLSALFAHLFLLYRPPSQLSPWSPEYSFLGLPNFQAPSLGTSFL